MTGGGGVVVHSTEELLPPLGKYVVCRYSGGNWHDSEDDHGVVWVVAKRRSCKVGGNDRLPFRWEPFGPGSFFGHDVDLWFDLPGIKRSEGL